MPLKKLKPALPVKNYNVAPYPPIPPGEEEMFQDVVSKFKKIIKYK